MNNLITKASIIFTAALLYACSSAYLIPQADLYKSTDDVLETEVDDTPVLDNGYITPIERSGWKLVWNDEFDSPTLDTSKWNYEVNGDGGGNNELQYYVRSKANAYIKDGKFVIKAIQQNYKGKPYTSTRVNTKNKGDWKYGRFDIRARLPIQQGIWPAIWMLPTDNVYGKWPKSGEIDIMEIIGQEPRTLHGTLHYGPEWPNNKHIGATIELEPGKDFSQEYHVFSCEWEENEIRFYLDDKLYGRRTPADLAPHPWPFDQRFHLILNLAIGGNWPGPPDETTQFPKYFFIDYVRVYQRDVQ